MFAPAIVGAAKPLSVTAFETCRSQLLNPGGSVAQGWCVPLLAVKSEELSSRRLDVRRGIRVPLGGANHSSRLSASIDWDGGSVWSRCLGLRRRVERSLRTCLWRDASRRWGWCATSQTMFAPYQRSERQRSSTGLEARARRGRVGRSEDKREERTTEGGY